MALWKSWAAVVLVCSPFVALSKVSQAQNAGSPGQSTPANPQSNQQRSPTPGQGNRLPCPIGSVPRVGGDNRPQTSPDVIAALSPEDKKALLQCLLKATDEGNGAAAGLLGEQYHASNGIVPQDYQKAFEYTRKALDLGNTRSLTNLANMYMEGEGVKKDEAEAMRLYAKAAENGDMKAPRDLGVNYEFGKGTPVDYAKAAHYYEMAAGRNDTTGQCLLGSLYERGLGVPQSYDKAAELYTKSASRGDIIASPGMASMGDLYETRKDGKQDIQIAIEWYKKAADLKFHEAQADYARLTGVDPKPAAAPRNLCLVLFEQKCDLPATAACKI